MEKILNNLIENTPDLLNFFAGYFPEAEFTGFTDKEVIDNYLSSNTDETIKQTQKDLETLKNDPELLEIIAREVNKHFDTSEKTWEWLQTIKTIYIKKVTKVL